MGTAGAQVGTAGPVLTGRTSQGTERCRSEPSEADWGAAGSRKTSGDPCRQGGLEKVVPCTAHVVCNSKIPKLRGRMSPQITGVIQWETGKSLRVKKGVTRAAGRQVRPCREHVRLRHREGQLRGQASSCEGLMEGSGQGQGQGELGVTPRDGSRRVHGALGKEEGTAPSCPRPPCPEQDGCEDRP